MRDEEHTPGPWKAMPEELDKPYIRIRGTRLGARYKIANVLTPVYEGAHQREAEETRSNAALIETAPDLLAVARRIVAYGQGYGQLTHIIAEASAAIAKASPRT